ncbi:MAG: hypothetical protein ABGW78_05965 [Pirellulales bacterium]
MSRFFGLCIILLSVFLLTTGCFSGAYEEDFKARLQQYKQDSKKGPPPVAQDAGQNDDGGAQ